MLMASGGGVYGGYNWQSDNIVYGAEADLGFSGADFTAGGLTGKQGFKRFAAGTDGSRYQPVHDLRNRWCRCHQRKADQCCRL
jgi:hypothetical protein